jgi:hypothetical protein
MTRRQRWITAFLSATLGVVLMELVAALDADGDTVPWTFLLVDHVPWPVWLAGSLTLSVWLPWHLINAYRERHPK